MKKIISITAILALVFTLVGCSSQTEVLSKTDLITKALEVSSNLKSYNLVIDINQKFSPKGEPEVINEGRLTFNRFADPFAVHFNASMKNNQFDISEEMYIDENSMYINNNILEQWFKTTDSIRGTASGHIKIMAEATNILDYMKQYKDQVTMSADKSSYILTLDTSNADHNEFVISSLESYYPSVFKLMLLMSLMNDLKEEITLNSSTFTLTLDKKTLNPLQFTFNAKHLSVAFNNEVSVEQNYIGVYANHNKVKDIKIPKEVIDEAISMEEGNN